MSIGRVLMGEDVVFVMELCVLGLWSEDQDWRQEGVGALLREFPWAHLETAAA